jgi:hypothetical protein
MLGLPGPCRTSVAAFLPSYRTSAEPVDEATCVSSRTFSRLIIAESTVLPNVLASLLAAGRVRLAEHR